MRMRGIKALAAAASLGVMALASQASASTPITVTGVGITGNYTASISGLPYDVYTGMMLFTAHATTGGQNIPDLYGFCIDVAHEIGLGSGQSLSYLDTMGDPGNLLQNYANNPVTPIVNGNTSSNPLDPSNPLSAITALVDTGFEMYEAAPNSAATLMNEAAIQAAIWQIENPNLTVTVHGDQTFQDLFTGYSTGNWVSTITPQDKVFTLVSQDGHQSFAIGWPGGVPEPTSWALMLTGFFGMGTMLRRQRKAAAATA